MKTFEIRVVDSLGYLIATVLLTGTVDGILKRKQKIISYILSHLSQLSQLESEGILFLELYTMDGEFITMLN